MRASMLGVEMPVDDTNTTASICDASNAAAANALPATCSNSADAPVTYALVRSAQPCGCSNHDDGTVVYRRSMPVEPKTRDRRS